jgi:hypothetical protein
MLTRQQVIDTFVAGINEIPGDELIETYTDGFTQEQLDEVVRRNLAIRQDPTFAQRLAEDYNNYMAATPEERAVWKQVDPNPAP